MSIKNLTKNQFKFTSIENSSSEQNLPEQTPSVMIPSQEEMFDDKLPITVIERNQSTTDYINQQFGVRPETVIVQKDYNKFAAILSACVTLFTAGYLACEIVHDPESVSNF